MKWSTKVAGRFQIEQDIIAAIKSGQLKPGDKVDSESVLKKKYNVSTITVRKAFTDLINEGYLTGIQGLGTFVAKKQMIRGLTSLSFSDELLQQGYEIDMHVDKIELITNAQIAEKLTIDPGSRFSASTASVWANGEPIAYQINLSWYYMLSLEQAQTVYDTKSFYKTLAQVNITPVWS